MLDIPESGALRLSAGLTPQGEAVHVLRGGVLRQTKGGQLYLDGVRMKRWVGGAPRPPASAVTRGRGQPLRRWTAAPLALLLAAVC